MAARGVMGGACTQLGDAGQRDDSRGYGQLGAGRHKTSSPHSQSMQFKEKREHIYDEADHQLHIRVVHTA